MYNKLLKQVTNLGSPRIMVVGDFMLDIYTYADAKKISPEAPVPVLKVKNTLYRCGGAGSVVNDLTALGANVICLGIIGNDPYAKIITDQLDSALVDTSALLTISDRPTTNKQRIIWLAQQKHPQQLIRIDEESTEPLDEKYYKQIIDTFQKHLPEVDIVCLQDYDKAILTPEICQKLIDLAKKQNKPVLVDPCFTHDYSKYTGATLITPNRLEARTASQIEINSPDSAQIAADKLSKQYDIENVVITLDKEGAYLKTPEISKHIPTNPRSVYDVTGAGDMVLATLAISIAAGFDCESAVTLSNITGGLEVEKFGAVPITIEEILKEIVSLTQSKTPKIITFEKVKQLVELLKKQNKKIVFTNGCFDVIHKGHIELLKFCKTQGDIVILGLNSDNSVKQLKGPERPINNQHDRAEVLAALESVDYVSIFDDLTPIELIKAVKPDILIKGAHWLKNVVGQEFVESNGGKVVLAPIIEGKSSTSTIEKIKSLASEKNE